MPLLIRGKVIIFTGLLDGVIEAILRHLLHWIHALIRIHSSSVSATKVLRRQLTMRRWHYSTSHYHWHLIWMNWHHSHIDYLRMLNRLLMKRDAPILLKHLSKRMRISDGVMPFLILLV